MAPLDFTIPITKQQDEWYEAKVAAEKLHLSVDTLKRRAKNAYYEQGTYYYRNGLSNNAKYIFNVEECRKVEMKQRPGKRPPQR